LIVPCENELKLQRLFCHKEFFKPWVISVVSFR
jgi:hypothetical protein